MTIPSKPAIAPKRPTIGLFVEGLDDSYETPIFHYFRQAALEADANFVCFSGMIFRGESQRGSWRQPIAGLLPEVFDQAELIKHFASSDVIDAIVFPSMMTSHSDEKTRAEFLEILKRKPTVTISQAFPEIPRVDCDNITGMRAVVDHLLTVHQVRSFAFVYDNDTNIDFTERQQAFYDTLYSAGIPASTVVRTHVGNMLPLVERIVEGSSMVEAVVCVDDRCARTVSSTYAEHGLYVPYDVLVTGFDGLLGSTVIPRITTARQPFDVMCRIAVDLALRALGGETIPLKTTVPGELVVMESCGCRSARNSMENILSQPAVSPREAGGSEKQGSTSTLAAALAESLTQKNPNAFLDGLDREIRQGFELGRDSSYWQRRLTLIGSARSEALATIEERLEQEKMLGLGRVFVTDLLERQARKGDESRFDEIQGVYRSATDMAGAINSDQIAEVVAGSLKVQMSISNGNVIFFDSCAAPPDAGILVVRNNIPLTTPEQRAVTVSTFLSEMLVRRPKPLALICNLLKCAQEPLGMSICEADIPNLEALLNLRTLVGNQIKMVHLIDQVRRQANDLTAANQQLNSLRAKEQEYLSAVKRELDLARQIQFDFLPRRLPAVEGWEVAAAFEPAREVSGDFYDIFHLPDERLGIVIADVSGKSVSAAIFMALVRSLVRALSLQSGGSNLLGVVPTLNEYITKNHNQTGGLMFVTLFYGVLDTSVGWLEYINAGHPSPVVFDGSSIRSILKLTGPAIGITDSATYGTSGLALKPGETLFAYTDGVTEAHTGAGALLGKDRLHTILVENASTPSSAIEAVKDEVLRHMHGEDVYDDITMVAVKRI